MASGKNSSLPVIDNLSFGIIAQVLPLLGIFGQEQTGYFLSQAIDWPDYLLFAIGPLGVIWVLTATFRILGTQFMKSKFGRGSEESALIERELMSSTSSGTCELWNGTSVDRLSTQAQIQEFWIYERLGQTEPIIDTPKKMKNPSNGEILFKFHGLIPEIDDRCIEESPEIKPPNLLLNLSSHSKRSNFTAVLCFAIPFQLGFIALAALMRFNSYLNGHFHVHTYAFGLTVGGTTVLFFGLLLCAYEISKTTVRVAWEPLISRTHNTYVLWLQRGLKDKPEVLFLYHSQKCQRQHTGVTLETVISVALFGGTVIMAIIRVALRQVPRPLRAVQTHHEHEMDWLALINTISTSHIADFEGNTVPRWALDGATNWERCKIKPGSNDTSGVSERGELVVDKLRWRIPVEIDGSAESVEFCVELSEERWQTDPIPLTSALSLWLFHAKQTERMPRACAQPRSVFCLGPKVDPADYDRLGVLKERLRYVKTFSTGDRQIARQHKFVLYKREVSRNLIAGFQASFSPGSLNTAYSHNIRSPEQDEMVTLSVAVDLKHNDAIDLGYNPAIVSFMDIATLYALHILTGFTWVLANQYITTRSAGSQEAGIVDMTVAPNRPPELERLADSISTTGLADRQDFLRVLRIEDLHKPQWNLDKQKPMTQVLVSELDTSMLPGEHASAYLNEANFNTPDWQSTFIPRTMTGSGLSRSNSTRPKSSMAQLQREVSDGERW
ncbi:hypothetical protein ASPACDRAFT_1857462 [Aspergillus aculeatus ATCC 16872]|uniref:Uncharacterized protein n=1 Tax=Aspergillus aculeatus (strain ATCC 16872 / CBS 172.66 / WB 5094) TaxID=690307 RepID=A0A1L9WRY1_ASPA1|nr:uncharacterized protein ASPACDRAFT_1857462 [Aspergillus aculeatus ATCC 16872]OJJ98999.1 hypothetical protein ASPACDRAFT_1857462 [Aspergillus aculeatus ATCC 16872]